MKRSRLRRSEASDENVANDVAVDRLEQASMKIEKRWKLPDDDQ